MPLYLYRCMDCGEFEEIKSMSDRKESSCPICGVTAKQVITPVAFDGKMGLDPDFPTFAQKWATRHERQGAK